MEALLVTFGLGLGSAASPCLLPLYPAYLAYLTESVNKDAEAPILQLADFSIVGDLFTVLPQATDEIKRRQG